MKHLHAKEAILQEVVEQIHKQSKESSKATINIQKLKIVLLILCELDYEDGRFSEIITHQFKGD